MLYGTSNSSMKRVPCEHTGGQHERTPKRWQAPSEPKALTMYRPRNAMAALA